MLNILNDNKKMLSTIPNLTKRCEIMSNEESGSYISNIASYFTNKLVDIKNIFISNNNQIKEDDTSTILKDMITMKSDMLYVIEHIKYTEYANIKIPTILGLKANLLDTVSELSVMLKLIDDNILVVMDDLDTTVSKIISDKNYRISTRPVVSKIDIGNINISIDKSISKIIDGNGTRDVYKLSELVPNMNSINLIYEDIIRISKGTGINSINSIKSHSTKISSKVDTLYGMLTDNKETNVSKVVINDLGYKLEQTATLVSNYASIIYLYNQVISTHMSIVKRLRTSIV